MGEAALTGRAHIFLGGWSVAASTYASGLPPDWACPEQPSFTQTEGRFDAYVDWARQLVAAHREVVLVGHSLGAAIAICVAADRPDVVRHVVAFAPAGLPSPNGMRQAARDVVTNGVAARLATPAGARAALRVLDHPRAALRLARSLESLDLSPVFARVGDAGIPVTVVAALHDRVAPVANCRAIAEACKAEYVEDSQGRDHLWVMTDPRRLRYWIDTVCLENAHNSGLVSST